MTSPWTFRQGTAKSLKSSYFMVSQWGDVVLVDGPNVHIPCIWPRILMVTKHRWPTEYAIGDLLGMFDKKEN